MDTENKQPYFLNNDFLIDLLSLEQKPLTGGSLNGYLSTVDLFENEPKVVALGQNNSFYTVNSNNHVTLDVSIPYVNTSTMAMNGSYFGAEYKSGKLNIHHIDGSKVTIIPTNLDISRSETIFNLDYFSLEK